MTFFPPFLLSFSTPVWLLSDVIKNPGSFPWIWFSGISLCGHQVALKSLVCICHQDSVPSISYHFTTEAFPFLQIKFWFSSTHINLFPLFCFFFLGIINSRHMPFFLIHEKVNSVKLRIFISTVSPQLWWLVGNQSLLAEGTNDSHLSRLGHMPTLKPIPGKGETIAVNWLGLSTAYPQLSTLWPKIKERRMAIG